jgi:aryl-alcohol dehydrogenase-like predicted oxidoreductase
MKYGRVEGIDKPVSRLVQGTLMLSTDDLEANIEFLDGIRALGCNSFDTAQIYGNGEAERTLGAWMDLRGNRSDVFILSKGGHHNADRRRVTVFDIASDLFDSLARLKTDYIDLYLLHRDDPGVPVGPLVEALNEHTSEGRIRAFGGSNWSVNRILEANLYARNHGLMPFVASSPNFSLAVRKEEIWEGCLSISGPRGAEERAWYRQSQMPVFTWSSLAQGFFFRALDTRKHFRDGERDAGGLRAGLRIRGELQSAGPRDRTRQRARKDGGADRARVPFQSTAEHLHAGRLQVGRGKPSEPGGHGHPAFAGGTGLAGSATRAQVTDSPQQEMALPWKSSGSVA